MLVLPLIAALSGAIPTTIERRADLELGLAAEAPWLDADEVEIQVASALAEESDELPAELMLGIAWRESGYHDDARPGCGVMQVLRRYAGGAAGCRRARSSSQEGYAAGARAYEPWIAYCRDARRARGVTVTECALNAYAEGGAAGRRGWGVKGCKRHRHCDRAAGPLGRARRIAFPAKPPSDV